MREVISGVDSIPIPEVIGIRNRHTYRNDWEKVINRSI